MRHEDVAPRIEAFVRGQFGVAPTDTGFSRSVPLFERGYVDSIGLAELLAFLIQEFAVEIPDKDLISDEFTTIDGIARIVLRRR